MGKPKRGSRSAGVDQRKLRNRLNATHRKALRTLREGTIDSTVSLSQISGIRFGVMTEILPLLIQQGYVVKTDQGYSLSAKGRAMADSLHEIWLQRKNQQQR